MAFEFGIDWTKLKPGNVNFDVIERLMGMDERSNRVNRMGLYGGWQYEQDPETGQWTQRQVITDPAMQAAKDRMDRRLMGEGFEAYEPPAQVQSMTDALMASRMQRMGILDPNEENPSWSLKQTEYGTRFGDRQGGAYQNALQAYAPPPPPDHGQPPPGGQPPPDQGQPPPGAGGPPPGAGEPPPGGGGGGGGGVRPNIRLHGGGYDPYAYMNRR